MGPCPSDQTLRMLGDGGLDSTVAPEVGEHIKACPVCRARLEALAWECPTPITAPPCPLPGVGETPQIFGFQIQEELGRGSMGVVYLARHEALGRQVAIKVMPAGPGADQQARKARQRGKGVFAGTASKCRRPSRCRRGPIMVLPCSRIHPRTDVEGSTGWSNATG